MTESFVPAAEEVSWLQRTEDEAGKLFRSFCEQGHYGGRKVPSSTRQGTYALAPSGALLGAINTRDGTAMARMLRLALQRFAALPAAERRLDAPRREALAAGKRWLDRYPDDGLVLAVTARDLGPPAGDEGWHATAWNRDWAWFTRQEAHGFLAAEPRVGESHPVPAPLALRLARCHLLDAVRGQTASYRKEEVSAATLTATPVTVDADHVELELAGATRAERRGRWPVAGFGDAGDPLAQEQGVATTLLGHATFDRAAGRFSRFVLLAVGERFGGTQFNCRGSDLGKAPIGFVLELQDAPERIEPAHIWDYGWLP